MNMLRQQNDRIKWILCIISLGFLVFYFITLWESLRDNLLVHRLWPIHYSYNRQQLLNIYSTVRSVSSYNTISKTCWRKHREYRLNKRREMTRGKKGTGNKQNKMFHCQHLRMLFHARMGIEKENLIKINTNINRWLTSKSNSILISTTNAQSLGNKHLQILDYSINHKIDIGIITEIWINEECPMLISDLNSQSYGFILFTRTWRGGGIGVMYNKNIRNPILEKQEYSTLELLTVKLCVSGKNITIYGVYHLPPSEQNKHTNQQFIDEFSEVMSLKIIETTEILILGDFNIVVNDPMDPDAQLLLAWLESNKPVQYSWFSNT